MKPPGINVRRWLAFERAEGPVTADDAGELVRALMWDGQLELAASFADDLTKWFMRNGGYRADLMFGEYLGIRSALSAVIACRKNAAEARKQARADRRLNAKFRPAAHAASGAKP